MWATEMTLIHKNRKNSRVTFSMNIAIFTKNELRGLKMAKFKNLSSFVLVEEIGDSNSGRSIDPKA